MDTISFIAELHFYIEKQLSGKALIRYIAKELPRSNGITLREAKQKQFRCMLLTTSISENDFGAFSI
ncbi:hypothetical protein ACVBIL_20065 [Shewanella sp. 125m-7]